ncbi:MAG: RbsD/FucU domain-containing protein [Akkermansiaceae bacterium]
MSTVALSMMFVRMLLIPFFALLGQGCASFPASNSWQVAVHRHVTQLGFRNWIVIAEASFPAYSRSGVHQVTAQTEITDVLAHVLQTIDQTQHVKPNVYLTRELRSMNNDSAPGIDELKKKNDQLLAGMEVTSLDQESLMSLISDANRSFEVLIIRTTSALPYSSVFLELQPGYWDAESEQQLRARIDEERTLKSKS